LFNNLDNTQSVVLESAYKDQAEILAKLKIESLNPMQESAYEAVRNNQEVILLSPTGTGKTLAFVLPILSVLDQKSNEVQVLILVPSRELAIQIEQVIREMGSGYKVNAVYGGRATVKDLQELKHPPAILIGTPGRVADHIRRETFSTEAIHSLVLDEFDKSLETGFEKDMKEIVEALPSLKKKVMTSATHNVPIPDFVGLRSARKLDYLDEKIQSLKVQLLIAEDDNKLNALDQLLRSESEGNGIVFCNYKHSISKVSDYLTANEIDHTCFFGGMEQQDRERSLIKFRNGTFKVLLATDLAARGIDVPELNYIIHYETPMHESEFIHRNGRTARMHSDGTAYVVSKKSKSIPDFIKGDLISLEHSDASLMSQWCTLFISGGRKDKISKGDIAGLFIKQGGLEKDELGLIELKQDCAFVSVPKTKADSLIDDLNNSRLKKKKVRIYLLD